MLSTRIDYMSTNKLSPLQAIRQFCVVCNGEIKGGKKYDCLCTTCTFYPWKEGKGVYEDTDSIPEEHKQYVESLGDDKVKKSRKGRVMSEEHKAKLAATKKLYWENRRNGVPN